MVYPSGAARATMAPAMVPAAPPLVLDHDRDPETVAEPLGDDARDTVARAARRKRDDEADRPVWKRRVRAAGQDRDSA